MKQSSEASIIEQLNKILDWHRIPHQTVESAEFAGLPYEVRIDATTMSFVEGFGVKVTKDGVYEIFLPDQSYPDDIKWDSPETETVELRILSQTDWSWKIIVTDKNGTQDTATFRGNRMVDLQQ